MNIIVNHENNRESVFDDCPGFYRDDNRTHRHFNPVAKEMLEEKLRVLLPQWLIKDKSILDLGCCLGAAGQWALYHGASSSVFVTFLIQHHERDSTDSQGE